MSRVLIVEDDPMTKQVMIKLLTIQSDDVYETGLLKDAFALAKRIKPDLLILDVLLPDGMSFGFCRQVRRDPQLYKIPILFVSAISDEPEIEHALSSGGDAYLVKPLTREQFQEKVLAMKRLREGIRARHPVSQLPGLEALRREIMHRIFREELFSLCYFKLGGYANLRKKYGAAGETQIIKLLTKLFLSTIKSGGVYESFTAHLSGGHFMILSTADDQPALANNLYAAFEHERKRISDPLRAHIGVVQQTNPPEFANAKQAIDRVRRLVESHESSPESGVYTVEPPAASG